MTDGTWSAEPGTAYATLPRNDPLWFKRAVFYEVLVRGFLRLKRRRHRRPDAG